MAHGYQHYAISSCHSTVKGLIDHTIKHLKKHQENVEVDRYEVLAKSV